ncbi:hypothetical protein WJX72_011300 [[Myrmecia] bisecta]|uniref:Glycoside hydrolase family 57 N-terminal domain-containing protein n=1 Tax=[Myrmecia] bisecta TaxID=41462 RepID=A0AAW1QB61_9CHLO
MTQNAASKAPDALPRPLPFLFVAFHLHLPSGYRDAPATQWEALQWLQARGFRTNPDNRRCTTFEEATTVAQQLIFRRLKEMLGHLGQSSTICSSRASGTTIRGGALVFLMQVTAFNLVLMIR